MEFKLTIIKSYFLIKLFFNILFFILLLYILKKKNKFSQNDITLVTALFNIKSKFKFNKYLSWVENLLQINTSIVFFIDKNISEQVKRKRPQIYENKTIWIEVNIENLFSYKNFFNNFKRAHLNDYEKKIHTSLLYIVWAEKCYFLKRAINRNYFNSKCFYWIDAGFFRSYNNTERYLNNWPSSKKCFEDPRVIVNSIRKLSKNELDGFKKLDIKIYNNIIRKTNVGGGFFGGNSDYLIKFILIYYKTIKLFIKKNMFIGKDQNIFAYIAYLNKNIVNIIYSGEWKYFAFYLLDKKKVMIS